MRQQSAMLHGLLNEHAQRVLKLANHEAQRFNHEYIGTEHLLLGLVKDGVGPAADVLQSFGVDVRIIRIEVEKLILSGPDMVTMGRLPMTPRAKKVIDYAVLEAHDLQQSRVDTDHLLLGLLREQESVAAHVLMNLGISEAAVRERLVELAGGTLQSGSVAFPETTLPFSLAEMYLSDGARRAMRLARDVADKWHEKGIGTLHLLYGVLRAEESVISDLFKRLGTDFDQVCREASTLASTGPEQPANGNLAPTYRTKVAVYHAAEEARALGCQLVGVEHLLLGLLHEADSQAAQALANVGLTLERTRDAVRTS